MVDAGWENTIQIIRIIVLFTRSALPISMKRRREVADDEPVFPRRSPRLGSPPPFPFRALFPELRGEIVTSLDDVDDRIHLAMTCKCLLAEIHPPMLPRQWRFLWPRAMSKEVVHYRQPLQAAFLEIITAGIPLWPGVFRLGRLSQWIDSDRDRGFRLWWRWSASLIGDYMHLFYYSRIVPSRRWQLFTYDTTDGMAHACADTLIDLLATGDSGSRLMRFLALDRHRDSWVMMYGPGAFDDADVVYSAQ